MTLLQAGRALLKATGEAQRHVTVQVLAPMMISNPNFPGVETPDWSNPTITTTINGVLQPVSEDTATRMGIASRTDYRTLYSDATTLNPEGRVRAAGSDWLIHEVRHWTSHTEAIIQRLTNG